MHVSHDTRTSTATIELLGEFDMAAEQLFESEVRAALASDAKHLVIDLRALGFMDSTGLLMLLKLDELSRQDGFRLWVVNDGANAAAKVMSVTGLDRVQPGVARPPDPLDCC